MSNLITIDGQSIATVNNTTGSIGSFVNRGDQADWDWTQATLTTDGTWRDLDCSAIVPASALAISFRVLVKDDAVESQFQLRKNGNSNALNVNGVFTQVANIYIESIMTVPCDANRVVEYYASNLTWSVIAVLINGWWI